MWALGCVALVSSNMICNKASAGVVKTSEYEFALSIINGNAMNTYIAISFLEISSSPIKVMSPFMMSSSSPISKEPNNAF
jgi:hypothetical protein